MSTSFSANAGSLERLKVRMRCGARSRAFQIRWTVRRLRFMTLAMARPVQWVVSEGGG